MNLRLYDKVSVHTPPPHTHSTTTTNSNNYNSGSSSSIRKAYACTNAMEFFAETSVAYLATSTLIREYTHETYDTYTLTTPAASTTTTTNNNNNNNIRIHKIAYPIEEYNKWYPHNSDQLRMHDPYTYNVLSKLWK